MSRTARSLLAIVGLSALAAVALHGEEWPQFRGTQAELIRTNLSNEQEAKLREAFGLEE